MMFASPIDVARTTALLACTAMLPAQDLVPKAAPQQHPIVLANATIHTVGGPLILGGSLWFQNGVIQGVLAADQKLDLPAGTKAEIVDLQGKHVYPGFVSAMTSLGLEEIGMVKQTVDVDELGDLVPEALALTAVNPDSTAIPVARSNGILTAAVFPRGGLLPGRASVIQLDGWTNAEITVRADAGPVIGWPALPSANERRGRRGARPEPATAADPVAAVHEARDRIDAAFTAAEAWLRARAADPSLPYAIQHVALAPALRREVPVFVLADDQEQIESAVLWARARGLHAVVVGGRDAVDCAALLKQHDVPVVLAGTHKLPQRDDSPDDEAFTRPAELARAGVRFCIASGADFSQERNLPYQAATAIAFGLDPKEALAAITLRPAEILGIADMVGSLAPGKMATLFVCDGDPLELPTTIEMAFVQGRRIDLRNKQTELANKYRERYRQLKAR
jgi:imidazolonepropionase-like amidohydrolase